MDTPTPGLAFEQPILDLEHRLHQLMQHQEGNPDVEEEIRSVRRELAQVMKDIYEKLSPWETVQVARHKNRPHTIDYLGVGL